MLATVYRRMQPLARTRAAQALLARPPVAHVAGTIARAGVVAETERFVLAELSRRPGVHRYHLRGSDVSIFVRHATSDIATVDEIFCRSEYEPPAVGRRILDGIERPLRILDLGANIGLFGAFAIARFRPARIVSYEPEPENAAVLARCVEANAHLTDWKPVVAAAAASEGEVAFEAGEFTASRIGAGTAPGELRVRTADVLAELADCDLAKIDIEGGEWQILADRRFPAAGPPLVVLEYHPHLCPGADARAAALELLQDAGYSCGVPFAERDGLGVLWAWRDRLRP